MLRPVRMRLRNRVAMPPLLRKGGVHERSRSGVRANAKRVMEDAITNWRDELEEDYLEGTDLPRYESGEDFGEFSKAVF